ncbi:MAG: hypothetical protein ACI97A_003103 [Planctomycetota bacterium]|jgi:hypothetical protein
MKRFALALLCGLALFGAQVSAQKNDKDLPQTKKATKAVFVVGVKGMT